VLALIAAAAVSLLFVTASQQVPAVPIALDAVVTVLGILASVLALIRVLDLPDLAGGREWALWLGLAGTLGVAGGGWVAVRDERLSPPGRHTDATGRPAPPPPEIAPIRAPDREGAR